MCADLFPQAEQRTVEAPTIKVHPKHRAILREMVQSGSDIIEYPMAKGCWQRIRLVHWPRTKGITEAALKTLLSSGLIRRRIWEPGSRSYPQYTLTTIGMKIGAEEK